MPQRDSKYVNDIHLGLLQGFERLTSEREVSLFFGMLMLVVILLLGIACLNVSGLLLAILGTAAGLLRNLLLTRLISQVTLDNLPVPFAFHISPDWRLLTSTALATASALLVGLLPAWRASRDPTPSK